MCGIVGIINTNKKNVEYISPAIKLLSHRGPDNEGIFISKDSTIGLAQTRLSIIDLSSGGNQPMKKHNLTLVFNGEIFNYKSLQEELVAQGYTFISTSDTEVLLSAFDYWGINCLQKLNGFFAFILFDEKKNETFIVRDRLGVKQLVYTKKGNQIIAASESKAIFVFPDIKKQPNLDVIESDLIFGFYGDRHDTYFKDIYHLEPGKYLHISNNKIKKYTYWDIMVGNSQQSVTYYENELYRLLNDSIKLRLTADCQISSLLSGGIDSSLITQLAANNTSEKIDCFTIKYKDLETEDYKKARLLVNKNGNLLPHDIEIYPSNFNLDSVDRTVYHMEEMLQDSAYISVFRNYEEIKKNHIKVVLNGQGADEIWLGYYDFYDFLKFSNEKLEPTKFEEYWNKKYFLKDFTDETRNKKIIKQNILRNYQPYFTNKDILNSLIAFSIKTHLQNMIMQEDRLSMANSVECRVPFLDFRIVELAMQIPSEIKILDKREKYLLRRIGKKILPKEIYNRKKEIFPIPPSSYNEHISRYLSPSYLLKSSLIKKILKKNRINLDKVSESDRWKLFTLTRFEKVFFN